MDSTNKTERDAGLPGFGHILEISILLGVVGGLADVSYLITRYPTLSADIPATLRFITAGFVLTTIAVLVYMAVVFVIVKPVAKLKSWSTGLTLAVIYSLALFPTAFILARNVAKLVAEESILVPELKILMYFLKYIWLVIPVCWAIGAWLANVRLRVDRGVLFGRLSAFAVSAGFYLVASISVQQRMLLQKANVESEVSAGLENTIITIVIFIIALILLPVLNLIAGRLAKIRNGSVLLIIWILFLLIPYIPPLISGRSLAGSKPSGAQASGEQLNLVLVSLDTVRYDDLGFNGSEIVETPNLDAIAEQSYVYDNAIVPFPMTGPSHISIFTGLQPDAETGHGVKSNGVRLSGDIPTLATILDEAGFNTGAIIGSSILSRQACGLERGFHYYHDVFNESFRARFLPDQIWLLTVSKIFRRLFNIREGIPQGLTKSADIVTDQAVEWLEDNSDDPFFLFVHYYDPHYTYAPPPPFDTMYMPEYNGPYKNHLPDYNSLMQDVDQLTREDIDYFRALYRGEISFVDQEIGRLIDWGEKNGIWDNTLLIFVSDHGESFEHDYLFSHTDRVYEQLIHVPLIIRHPDIVLQGMGGKRVRELVNCSDIFGTVLEMLQISTPVDIDEIHRAATGSGIEYRQNIIEMYGRGTGLRPNWNYIASQAYLFENPGLPELSMGRFFSLRGPDWHLIYGPEAEPQLPIFQYYDLNSDPLELNNIYPEIDWSTHDFPNAPIELEAWSRIQGREIDLSNLSPEMHAELKALGYLNEGPAN